MADYNDLKVQTFTGINDVPVAPTTTKAGNGAHLINVLNSLLDRLSAEQNTNWRVITSDTEDITLEANTRYLITIGSNGIETMVIRTPTVPIAGDCVTLLKVNSALTCTLSVYPQISGHGGSEILLTTSQEEISLVYLNEIQGWVTNKANVLTFVQSPG